MTPTPSSPKIHIERMMHRSSIAVMGETAASYALIKLIPTGSAPLGINLALVLDVSGSMYEEDGTGASRLSRIQKAAVTAIQKLKPTDTLCLVAFAHNCQVILPPTPLSEKAKIEEHINKIDMFDVDPGGTAMDMGIEYSMNEIEKNAKPGKLSQLIVLTDGETSGERRCKSRTWPSWVRATGATSTSTTSALPIVSSTRSFPPWPPPVSSTWRCTCASRRT
jgi:Mg-chelatase subunit ChlD